MPKQRYQRKPPTDAWQQIQESEVTGSIDPPLSEAQNAYQQVLGGHTQGKLVLRVMSKEEGMFNT